MKKDSEAEGEGIELENEYGTGKFRVRKCGTLYHESNANIGHTTS